MARDSRRARRGKRGFRQVESREEDEKTVDDLAHAAQFAIFPAPAVAEPSGDDGGATRKEDDDNEIEVSEDEEDDEEDNDDSDVSIDDAAHKDDDQDSSSDDESDDDLAEALERMERASAEEEAKSATVSNPPKTENEVDGYKVPIQELESQLQIQLTLKGGKNESTKDISTNEVSVAGKLKNYMILDRTVVVESISNAPTSQNAIGPLDEGSLLVVKKPNGEEEDDDETKASWIPLGRIFEVFGPVSQPLYTIRLPSPPKEPKKAQKSSKPKKNETEIDPNEDKAKEDKDENEDQSAPTKPQTSCNPTSESDTSSPNTVEKATPAEEVKNSDSMTTDETSNDVETEVPLPDLWAKDGEYAKFLSQNMDIEVFYIQDEAKTIDTGLVLRTSGKGCDASNIYDEEILDASEAYYSDDEKEREAKNKKKNRKKRQQGNNGNRGNPHRPHNFNHSQQFQPNTSAASGQQPFRSPPPPPPPQNYGYGHYHAGSLPSGFHPRSQQGGFAQPPSTLYQYPAQSAFHGRPSMPPPPPPPQHNQQHPYQRTSSIPPPPPPPRNPNEPPAYQY